MKTIKFNIKKIYLASFLIFISILTILYIFSVLCQEKFKDINTSLPKPYVMQSFNNVTNMLFIEYPKGTYSNALFDGIVDYETKDDYILLLDMKINVDTGDSPQISYSDKKSYWAINYKTREMIGPMSEPEFYRFRRNYGLLSVHLSIPDTYWSHCCNN